MTEKWFLYEYFLKNSFRKATIVEHEVIAKSLIEGFHGNRIAGNYIFALHDFSFENSVLERNGVAVVGVDKLLCRHHRTFTSLISSGVGSTRAPIEHACHNHSCKNVYQFAHFS